MQLSLLYLLDLMKSKRINSFIFSQDNPNDQSEPPTHRRLELKIALLSRRESIEIDGIPHTHQEAELQIWRATSDVTWYIDESQHGTQYAQKRWAVLMLRRSPLATVIGAASHTHKGDPCATPGTDSPADAANGAGQCSEAPVVAYQRMYHDATQRANNLQARVDSQEILIKRTTDWLNDITHRLRELCNGSGLNKVQSEPLTMLGALVDQFRNNIDDQQAEIKNLQGRVSNQAESLAEVLKVVGTCDPKHTIAETVQTVIEGQRNRIQDLVRVNGTQSDKLDQVRHMIGNVGSSSSSYDLVKSCQAFVDNLKAKVREEYQTGTEYCELWQKEQKVSEGLRNDLHAALAKTTPTFVGVDYAEGVWVEGRYCQDRLFHAIAASVEILQGRIALSAKKFDENMAASNPEADRTVLSKFQVSTDGDGKTTIKAMGSVVVNAVGDVTVNTPETQLRGDINPVDLVPAPEPVVGNNFAGFGDD